MQPVFGWSVSKDYSLEENEKNKLKNYLLCKFYFIFLRAFESYKEREIDGCGMSFFRLNVIHVSQLKTNSIVS